MLLFTPGPLTTTQTVRGALLEDWGSRDPAFVKKIRWIENELLAVAQAPAARYSAVLLPGSGTYAVEATLSTVVPDSGKLLILINGAYGRRMQEIAQVHGIPHATLEVAESQTCDPNQLEHALTQDASITHVAVVHCETTTGILNPLEALSQVCRSHGKSLIADAMSSFGGLPFSAETLGIDYLMASSNKCVEGVPGLSFVIACTEKLEACAGQARTLSLDLLAQHRAFKSNGQFRFTPPTHVLAALAQALQELKDEGGVVARNARYRRNHTLCVRALRELGLKTYLPDALQGPIITSFLYPSAGFDFGAFYQALADQGPVIYPGKLSKADCFRIGHIGALGEDGTQKLCLAIQSVLKK